MKNEIIIFEDQDIKLEVNMKDETVWLNLEQMTRLFGRDKSVISRHIKNIFSENELERNSVVANFATTANDGKTYNVEYYNLDIIISVGYRVKSRNGTLFRKWANKVLKDYMIKGYAVNQQRLEYLEKTIKLIDIANRIDERLEGNDAKEILKVIGSYSKALNLLDDYDHKTLKKIAGTIDDRIINYQDCMDIISKLKFNENSNIFGIERDNGLESIINNIYQSFGGQDIYKSIEEKASNFLYLTVKNHVFIDGNKRIKSKRKRSFNRFSNELFKRINVNNIDI